MPIEAAPAVNAATSTSAAVNTPAERAPVFCRSIPRSRATRLATSPPVAAIDSCGVPRQSSMMASARA